MGKRRFLALTFDKMIAESSFLDMFRIDQRYTNVKNLSTIDTVILHLGAKFQFQICYFAKFQKS